MRQSKIESLRDWPLGCKAALASSCICTLGIVMPCTPMANRAAIQSCSAASPPMSGSMWKDARTNEVKTSASAEHVIDQDRNIG